MTQIKHLTPAPGLEALLPLVGKWHTEGERLAGPFGEAAPFVAVETFEWLEGARFLIHRVTGRFDATPTDSITLIGLDAAQLVAHTYDHDGQRRVWRVSASAPGRLELQGKLATNDTATREVRCVLAVEDEGNTLQATWSYQEANGVRTFLTARSTKAQPLPSASVGV